MEERLIFRDPPTAEEVRRLAAKLPGGVLDIVSQRGRRYKEMGLKDQQLSAEEWVDLLTQEPGLWRRPIAVKGNRVVIGFDPEALTKLAGA